jgi:uncharacterized protein
MRRTSLIVLMLLAALVLVNATPVSAQTTPAAPGPAVVVASGEHRIKVAADQAWATVAVETRDAKAPEARRLAAAAMTSVVAALKKTGLSNDAVQTVGFSLNPEYEYVSGRQRMKGFIVSNQVQVRIDDIAKVADVLDAVGGLTLPPSSNINIGGLRFDLKNRAEVEREALRGAVQDATLKAKAMAAGGGMSLGRTLRIEENAGQVMPKFNEPYLMARAAPEGVPTPITPGDIEIRAQVTLTIEIVK